MAESEPAAAQLFCRCKRHRALHQQQRAVFVRAFVTMICVTKWMPSMVAWRGSEKASGKHTGAGLPDKFPAKAGVRPCRFLQGAGLRALTLRRPRPQTDHSPVTVAEGCS